MRIELTINDSTMLIDIPTCENFEEELNDIIQRFAYTVCKKPNDTQPALIQPEPEVVPVIEEQINHDKPKRVKKIKSTTEFPVTDLKPKPEDLPNPPITQTHTVKFENVSNAIYEGEAPRLNFKELMKKINQLVLTGKITTEELLTLINAQGIPSLPDLKDHENLVPKISLMVDELAGIDHL